MLFKDILDSKYEELRPQFEYLYRLILEKQTHDSDLLLVHINAFYNPDVHSWDNLKEKMSPYTFGPNYEAYSEHTHHNFIGEYIKHNISDKNLSDYLKQVAFSAEGQKEINKLNLNEANSIQIEMLIYLKIWEADSFIKKFYQLANLSAGNAYDWHYKLTTSKREKGATGTRDDIIRKKIRDKFEKIIPRLYDSFKKGYNSQIRNSIAHSQYSIIGRHIYLNNFIKEDKYSQLQTLSFDEWIEDFMKPWFCTRYFKNLSQRLIKDMVIWL